MEDNQLIGIFIKQINYFECDFLVGESFVEGYLVDTASGTCVKANSSNSNLSSYHSTFVLEQRESETRVIPQSWRQLLIIDKNISDLNSTGKILIFEVCRSIQLNQDEETNTSRIAFAFLVPLASDGSMNTNQDLKLQLYKIRKNCKISHQDCSIYHLYADHKIKKLLGSLQLSVKGVVPLKVKQLSNEEKLTKSHSPSEEEKQNEIFLAPKTISKTWEWSRLSAQSCKVPNKIHKIFSPGKNGFSCFCFSRDGIHIAGAVLSKIIIYEVITGIEIMDFKSHIGFIYELDWSFDDKYLLSVSNDCRAAIWNVSQSSPVFILPHPSYVYCGKWFGNNHQIVTGGRDHLIRFWRKNEDGFCLVEEMGGHCGFISALASHPNSLLISGDSLGCIIIRKYENDNWTQTKSLTFSEFSQKVIDSVFIHSSNRRIIVSVRSRSSYLIDFVSGIILQTYKSALSTFARSLSCLTPCESYFFSFCQNGNVGVWEVNTGKTFAMYCNLFTVDRMTEFSGCIHYHPYEHMLGISALGANQPLIILKYDTSKNNDSVKLGLSFPLKKTEYCSSEKKLSSDPSFLPVMKQRKQ